MPEYTQLLIVRIPKKDQQQSVPQTTSHNDLLELSSLSPQLRLTDELALTADRVPLPQQHDRRQRQRQRHKTQEATRPPKPQIRIHALRRQRQPRREQILPERDGRDGASRELGVRVRDIHVHGGDDDHDREPDEREPDGRDHPMHMREARPAVPEEPAGEPDQAGGDAQRQAGLGDGNARFVGVPCGGTLVVGVLREAGEEAEAFADEEGDLDEPAGGVAEGVVGGIDLGDALGHDEDQAEAEGCPEHEEEDDGLGEEEVGGANDGFGHELG